RHQNARQSLGQRCGGNSARRRADRSTCKISPLRNNRPTKSTDGRLNLRRPIPESSGKYFMKKTNLHTARATAASAIPIFLLAAVAASPVQAQRDEGQFEFSPFVGEHKFESKQNLEDAFTYGLRLGYTITPNWSVEGAVSFVETNVDNTFMT